MPACRRARVAASLALVAAHCVAPALSAQPAQPDAPREPPAPPVIVAPKLIGSPDVPYPQDGRGDARVVVTLVVDSTGTVTKATADVTNPPFSALAEAAVRSWRFEPATRNGVVMAAKIKVELVFKEPQSLEDPSPDPESEGAPPSDQTTPEAPPPPPVPKVFDVTVTGERGEPGRTVTFSRAEVRQIPGTFGDPFRAIEAMPGVTPIVSGLPFFFIRGAPPGNVGYFLDGIRVPLLFHVGIGPSVVHPGIVDRVDLYPGGYPARFGRFAGGIVAGETTEPVPRWRGEYNLRLFDAGAMVEAPFADGRGIALVVVQPPVRPSYFHYVRQSPTRHSEYRKHVSLMKDLSKELLVLFWPVPGDAGLDEGVFVDYGHFSEDGAAAFSALVAGEMENCIGQLKSPD